MMPNNIRTMRMAKEISELARNPPHGITCWAKNDRNDLLEAIVQGSKETPYENGNFRLDIVIPERYPMDPPQIKFLTKVYHPNIDHSTGLICLDLLKMPPQGRWRPTHNISLILTAVQQLLSEPNPRDPLDAAIAQEYIANKSLFLENAMKWTQLYAVDASSSTSRLSQKRKCPDESASADTAKRLCTSSQNCNDSSSSTKREEPKEPSTVTDSEKSAAISPPLEDVSAHHDTVLKRKRTSEQPQEKVKKLFLGEAVKHPDISSEPPVKEIENPEKNDRN